MNGPRSTRRAARFARAVDADPRSRDTRRHSGPPAPAAAHSTGSPGSLNPVQPSDSGDVGAEHLLDPETRSLVTLAERLRCTRIAVEPDPQFRDRLRQRLVAVASVQLPAQAEHHGRQRVAPGHRLARGGSGTRDRAASARPRMAFVVAMLCSLVGLSGMAIVASHQALPGDTLYSLKRTTEDVSFAMARSDEAKAWRLLGFAQTRAGEIQDVVEKGFTVRDTATVLSTLADMDVVTRDGARLLTRHAVLGVLDAPLADLVAWSADQRALLDPMVERLSGDAAAGATQSMALLDQIRVRVDGLRSQLGCTCLDGAHLDDLGPLPCWPCQPVQPPQPPLAPPPNTTLNGPPVDSSGSLVDQPPLSGAPPGSTPSSPSATPTGPDGLPDLPSVPPDPSDGGLLPPGLLPPGLLPPLLPGILPS